MLSVWVGPPFSRSEAIVRIAAANGIYSSSFCAKDGTDVAETQALSVTAAKITAKIGNVRIPHLSQTADRLSATFLPR